MHIYIAKHYLYTWLHRNYKTLAQISKHKLVPEKKEQIWSKHIYKIHEN